MAATESKLVTDSSDDLEGTGELDATTIPKAAPEIVGDNRTRSPSPVTAGATIATNDPLPNRASSIRDAAQILRGTKIPSIEWKNLQFELEMTSDQNSVSFKGKANFADATIVEWRPVKTGLAVSLDDNPYEEFVQLVRFLNDLRSSHTVLFIGYCIHDISGVQERMFYITEYIEDTLSSFLKSQTLNRSQLLKLVTDVAKGLCYLHTRGIFCRCVEPKKIVVERTGTTLRAKLSEFSLASLSARRARGLYIDGYSAPEVMLGEGGSLASDIYSFGLILFETLANRKPFLPGVREANQFATPNPPFTSDVFSGDVINTINACLSPMADNRPVIVKVTEILEKEAHWEATQLCAAARDSDIRLVKAILERSPWVINQKNQRSQAALYCAARQGHTAVVRFLLEKGADHRVTQETGSTPLHAAAFNGHMEVVQLLLKARADCSIRNQMGLTPAEDARDGGHMDIATLLNAHTTNLTGTTPVVRGPPSAATMTLPQASANNDGTLPSRDELSSKTLNLAVTDPNATVAASVRGPPLVAKPAATTDATNATFARRTLTVAEVGETAARALVDVGVDERLAAKFEQVLIPWEDIEIGAEVGAGAFGTVVRGEHFNAPVAVKLLTRMVGRDLIGQFVEEASVLQKVNYLHIVRLMGVCIGEDRYGIVMEFATGGDLGSWLSSEAGQASDRNTRVSILADVCKGLTYLHKKGIVHRDIKPANILLDKAIHPAKLGDFGISGLATTGTRGGTPRYMAPEVIVGEACKEPSDVFSLAVVLWEVIARQTPYPWLKVDANHRVDRGNLVAPPGPATGDVPIDAILARAFRYECSERPKASELLQQLLAA